MITEAKNNPLIIKEGKFINSLLKSYDNKDLKIYDPKTKRTFKGQDAKQLIDDIDNNRFVDANTRIMDPQSSNEETEKKKKQHEETRKKAKTVNFKKVN